MTHEPDLTDTRSTRPLQTSTTIAALAAALARAQGAFRAITKDKTASIQTKAGGHFSYSYVDLATVLAAIREPLAANELALTQAVSVHGSRLSVETTLLHSSGEWIASTLDLAVADGVDPRSVASTITYGRRFSLTALVGIAPADEDDDAAAAVSTPKARRTTVRPDGKAAMSAEARDGDIDTPPRATAAPKRQLTDRQRKLLFATARSHRWTDEELRDEMERGFGTRSTGDLQPEDFDPLLRLLQRRPRDGSPSAPRDPRQDG